MIIKILFITYIKFSSARNREIAENNSVCICENIYICVCEDLQEREVGIYTYTLCFTLKIYNGENKYAQVTPKQTFLPFRILQIGAKLTLQLLYIFPAVKMAKNLIDNREKSDVNNSIELLKCLFITILFDFIDLVEKR